MSVMLLTPIYGTLFVVAFLTPHLQPQAVNAEFDVFTGNRRDVVVLNWKPKPESAEIPVAFVAVGAMLVGSIAWTNANQGSSGQRGDELGYFAYGGTCLAMQLLRVILLTLFAFCRLDRDLRVPADGQGAVRPGLGRQLAQRHRDHGASR